MILAATAVACGAVSAVLTRTAARLVGITAAPASVVYAAGAAAMWAWTAALLGLRLAMPLIPVAVVAAPLAVTDGGVRRLPDNVTLPAGSGVAAAMVAASAAGSSGVSPWLAASSALALGLVGHVLAARGVVPRWCAALSVWAATATACVVSGSPRLATAVGAGALITTVVLVAHLCGQAGFGDVKIAPLVCGAAWATWDAAAGFWFAAAAAAAALWLSMLGGGLVGLLSKRESDGGPLGALLPGATLAVALAGTWL